MTFIVLILEMRKWRLRPYVSHRLLYNHLPKIQWLQTTSVDFALEAVAPWAALRDEAELIQASRSGQNGLLQGCRARWMTGSQAFPASSSLVAPAPPNVVRGLPGEHMAVSRCSPDLSHVTPYHPSGQSDPLANTRGSGKGR